MEKKKRLIKPENIANMENVNPQSKKALWAGRIISIICILFMIVDGGMKLFKATPSMEGSAQLGWPLNQVQTIGITSLICALLYIFPRTAILGAILLTAYLGGAISIMVRAEQAFYFPLIFGVLVWAGVYFRNEKLRTLIPIIK